MLFDKIKNSDLISVIKGNSVLKSEFNDRAYYGLIYKISGRCEYTFKNGEKITLGEGNIIYLPVGSSYSVKMLDDVPSSYITLNFSADMCENQPHLFVEHNKDRISNDFEELLLIQAQKREDGVAFKELSLFYDILAELGGCESRSEKEYWIGKIEKSYNYLHENLYKSSLVLDDVPSLSGVSGTYFREIFKKITNESPKKYVTDRRMEYAKKILFDGDFLSVSDVAYAVGYDDALYFGKVFKSYYGFSPKNFMEMFK